MGKRLTVSQRRQVAKLAAEGMSQVEIAEKLRVARGTVQNILKESPAAAPEKREELFTDDELGEPVSPGQAHEWHVGILTRQIQENRAVAMRARRDGDLVAFQRAAKAVDSAALLLARVQKQAEGEPEGTFVTSEAMAAAAAQCRDALRSLVERRLGGRKAKGRKAKRS